MNSFRTSFLALLAAPVLCLAQTTTQTRTTVVINGDTTTTTRTTVTTNDARPRVDIHINRDRNYDNNRSYERNRSRTTTSRLARRFSKDFGVYVGLNNYTTPAQAGFDLKPGESRFVALSWRRNILLNNGRGRTPKLRVGIGPEVAWNNFAFEENRVLINNTNPVSATQPGLSLIDDSRDLKRSKLVACQFNVPVVFNVLFKSGLTLGVGGYAGVRLDSYTKVKPEGEEAVRNHGSYALENVRWGLTTEFGWRDEARLFVRYEPSDLFRAGQGPNVNVWAVGFRL